MAAPLDPGLDKINVDLGRTPLITVVSNIINVVLGLLGLIAVCLVVYGGFLWMTAAGNEEQIEKAKNVLTAALIGLVIILLAYTIVFFVISKLLEATDSSTGPSTGPSGGPGGGSIGATFYIDGMSPVNNASDVIRNVKVRVIFNYPIDASTVAGNVSVATVESSAQVPTNITVKDGNKIEINPNTACPAPNETLKCFEKNTAFKISVTQGSSGVKDASGKELTCSFKWPCISQFTTGELIDTEDPKITMVAPSDGQAVSVNEFVNLKAQATDDSGISYIDFLINGTATEESVIPVATSSKTFEAKSTWDTTGLLLKSWHKIKAMAYDLDDHSKESNINNAQILAAHCFDTVKNFDETGIDCGVVGGDCRLCDGTSCTKDNECAGGECLVNQCVTKPVISGVSPDNGTPNNFITIFGSGFGVAPGVVTFLGETGSADDKTASVPVICNNGWSDKQIVVAVPIGAKDGPIEVKNVSTALTDITNDTSGPLISDFIINDIKRPGLCAIAPARGESFTIAAINGIQLGTSNASSTIVFGNVTSPVKSWSDTNISTTVPNLQPSGIVVYAVVNGEKSNGVSFAVIPSLTLPKIDFIDPVAGPKGEYVTITGSNFGTTVGTVYFQYPSGVRILADIDFPKQCGTNFWHDDYVIVKVPAAYNLSEGASAKVILQPKTGFETNAVDFTVNNATLRPAICRIDPDNGPIGLSVNLYGERFQEFVSGKTEVKFYNSIKVTPAKKDWTDTTIFNVKVPISSQTGPVKIIDKNGSLSNPINFKIGACASNDQCSSGFECCSDNSCRVAGSCAALPGAGKYSWSFSTGDSVPRVIEECNSTTLPSPSPWDSRPDGDKVCVNAIVAVRFTPLVATTTLMAKNIIIKKCNTDQKFDDTKCATITPGVIQSFVQNATQNGFAFIPVDPWVQNTWYSGEITLGVTTPKGASLVSPYKWQFKTRDSIEFCKVGSVEVTPETYLAKHKNPAIDYSGSARSAGDQCVLINPNAYVWTWSSGDVSRASVSTSMTGPATQATPLQETDVNTPVQIKARIESENKEDVGDLTIKFADPRIKDYWPNCQSACVNAVIGVKFDTTMDASTLTSNNIKLYKCKDATCAISAATAQIIKIDQVVDNGADTHQVIFSLFDGKSLAVNTSYKVIIVGGNDGVKSVDSKKLIDGNYDFTNADIGRESFSWLFKTKDDNTLCAISRVDVLPDYTILNVIPTMQKYNAAPFSSPDSCNASGQMLKPDSYTWGWSSATTSVATMPIDITTFRNEATTAGEGATAISAITTEKQGVGALIVQCGYTTDQQCTNGPAKVAVGSDTCCWVRPVIDEVKTSACINGIPVITFNQVMDQKSFDNNVKLRFKKYDGELTCPTGTKTVTGDDTACASDFKTSFTTITDSNISKTQVKLTPTKYLEKSRDYKILVIGDTNLVDNKNEGVKNQVGVSMSTLAPVPPKASFTTGHEVCVIDKVKMSINNSTQETIYDEFNCTWPNTQCVNDIDKVKDKEQHLYTAQALDSTGSELQAKYNWKQCTDPLNCVLPSVSSATVSSSTSTIEIAADKQDATAFVSAEASDPASPEVGKATGTVEVKVFLCQDKGALLRSTTYNFETYYCRDRAEEPENPLPIFGSVNNSCLGGIENATCPASELTGDGTADCLN